MTEYSSLKKSRKEAKVVGDTRYFTGQECKRGHISDRLTTTGQCMVCVRAQKMGWYLKNRNAEMNKARIWKENNREKYLDKVIKWRLENQDIVRELKKVSENRRRARIAGSHGNHTRADISRIRCSQRDRCACCGEKLKGKGHADHIVPLSKGGSNSANNIQILCAACNCSKGARDPIDFMQSRGMLL